MKALRLLPLLAFVGCATVKTQPIIVSSHLLDAAGMTFEVVAAGMFEAAASGALTEEQVLTWNDFTIRWSLAYGKAVTQWVEAKQRLDLPAADQAAGLLTGLLAELGTFQIVLLGASP